MSNQLANTLVEYIKARITGRSVLNPTTLTENDIDPDVEADINQFLNNESSRQQIINLGIVDYISSTGKSISDPTMKQQIRECFQSNREYIVHELIGYCTSILDRYKRLRKETRQKQIIRGTAISTARNELIDKVNSTTTPPTKYQFTNLSYIKALKQPEDRELLWDEFRQRWNQKHPDSAYNDDGSKKRRPPAVRPVKIKYHDDFSDKLNNYVTFNHDKLLTLEEFTRVSSGWPQTSKPIEEWYQTYLDRFHKQPGTFKTIHDRMTPQVIAFKSPYKVSSLKRLHPDLKPIETTTTTYFPLKENLKKYQLHKVARRGTYIIDLVFVGKLCYLFAINVNTRYLFVELMNEVLFNDNATDEEKTLRVSVRDIKTATTFIKTLQKLIRDGMRVMYLQGDGEKAFNSDYAWRFYAAHNITFTEVPRMKVNVYPDFMKNKDDKDTTDPLHGSLGILDRVVRTIRDMAYNMEVKDITPGIMKSLVSQYNESTHGTLSKYAGMDVSPAMVQDDEELEEFICRRICQDNYNIMSQRGFNLDQGTSVKIYNEKDSMSKRRSVIQPGKYYIKGFKNGLYEVVDDKNRSQMVPRYRIDYNV